MNEVIVCNINMFDNTQKIFIFKDGQKKFITDTNMENISNYILGACSEYNLNNVHLFGDKHYLEKIISNIKDLENKVYGLNNIEIEVN